MPSSAIPGAAFTVRARYEAQQAQLDASRLARGTTPPVPTVTGPSFAERLRGLLPPEQTMTPVTRMLTGRAAEQLAQQRAVAPNGPGEGRSVDVVVVDGGAVSASDYANGLEPTPSADASGSNVAQLHAVLGHVQRMLGAPVDATLAEGLRLLGREPLSAPLIRPAQRYLARQADAAYRRLAA